jgi:hypothetical protein
MPEMPLSPTIIAVQAKVEKIGSGIGHGSLRFRMTADGRGIFCSHMGELAVKVAHGKAPDRDFSRMHCHRPGGAYFLCASFLQMGSWRELSDSLPQSSPAVLTRVDFPACQSMIV